MIQGAFLYCLYIFEWFFCILRGTFLCFAWQATIAVADTTEIRKTQIKQDEKLDELLSRTDNLITPTTEESLLSIIDNNKEFTEKFTDSESALLFLDKK